MKMKWSKIVLLCGVAATVLVGLLFSEDAAMVTSKVIWIIFDISAAVDAYIQKNKVRKLQVQVGHLHGRT
jgi:hypothetical protein